MSRNKPRRAPSAAPPARDEKPLVPARSVRQASPAFVTYEQQGIGMNFGQHPKLIDDCLNRSILTMQVFTGSGNATEDLAGPPSAIHPAIVGVDPSKTGAGPYQVSADYREEDTGAQRLEVTASPGVTWSILVLTQKAKG